jgi:hypothetical protein
MSPFAFARVPEIHFGPGKLLGLPQLLGRYGRRALFITGSLRPFRTSCPPQGRIGRRGNRRSARVGTVVGIDRFGESGLAAQVFEFLGITADKIAEAVEGVITG